MTKRFLSPLRTINFQALKQQILEDGSQANILTAIQMRLNEDRPVMYTAFAKTVRLSHPCLTAVKGSPMTLPL
jgi:hypothetical protein